MKEIPLTQGKVALVDDEDYGWLSKYKWTIHSNGYVKTWTGEETEYMHRMVMNAVSGQEVDHIDREKLNCQKSNLRFATRSQNNANRDKRETNNCGYKGVRWEEGRKRFLARIGVDGKTYNLGRYKSAIDAAKAYNKAALEIFGEFAKLNDV